MDAQECERSNTRAFIFVIMSEAKGLTKCWQSETVPIQEMKPLETGLQLQVQPFQLLKQLILAMSTSLKALEHSQQSENDEPMNPALDQAYIHSTMFGIRNEDEMDDDNEQSCDNYNMMIHAI